MTEGLSLLEALRSRAGVPVEDLPSLVVAISRIPYGRPGEQTPEAVVAAWRGTCTTKHVLLQRVAPTCEPGSAVDLVHRVYEITREATVARWGRGVADSVPAHGLVDVHTYALVHRGDGEVTVDVTFPISEWDGTVSLPLACPEGEDFPAGDDPMSSKAALIEERCDPTVREPFIAALAREFGRSG